MRMTEEQYQDFCLRHPKCAPDRVMAKLDEMLAPKPSKYGNTKVTDSSGAVHDSKKEFNRWEVLKLRERAGEITELRRQVPFALVVDGVLICQYIADFVYFDGKAAVIEDVKSPITRKKPEYRLKLKLMQAIHKIQIIEV